MKILLPAALAALFALPTFARVVPAISDMTGLDNPDTLPQLLSQTGLYTNIASASRQVTAGIHPFTVNAPLWSDGAHKTRWIQVPEGTMATPRDTSLFDFPDHTVFIKNFAIDSVYGDSTTRILVETRFLVVRRSADTSDHRPDIAGLSYKWQRDQKDAHLVSQNDGDNSLLPVRWGGRRVGKRWRYPSQDDCRSCHASRGVLGFIVPQLNDGKQLQALAAAGVISRDPLGGRKNAFRWYGLQDKSAAATLEARSRSWLAANCSHCHGNNNSPDGCDQIFEYLNPNLDIRNIADGGYVGRTSSDAVYTRLLVPGRPDSSYVMRRITLRGDILVLPEGNVDNTGSEQMPPKATFQVDSAAIPVLRDWICSLKPGNTCKAPAMAADETFWDLKSPLAIHGLAAARPAAFSAFLDAQSLVVKGGKDAFASLFDARGTRMPIVKTGVGRYSLGFRPTSGYYFVRVGKSVVRAACLP